MDLLQTVRKEGSRGGRSEFSWSEVQGSAHRENYLGHSLMAPVGRWQKGRDLNWYAKGNDGEELTEEQKREIDAQRKKDEIRKIKEREEDEMRKALGLEPIERGDGNANLMPLGARDDKELQKVIQETTRPHEEEEEAGGKGLGFGGFEGRAGDEKEVLRGKEGPQLPAGLDKRRTRSRSRSREHRRRRHDEDRPRRRRSRSRDREREHRRHRSRSRDHHHSRRAETKRAYHDDNRNRDRDRDHRPRRDDNYRPNREERKDDRRERPRSLERRPRTRSPGERRDRDRRR